MARYVGRHRKHTTPTPVKAVAAAAVVAGVSGIGAGVATAQTKQVPAPTTALMPGPALDTDQVVRDAQAAVDGAVKFAKRDVNAATRGIANSLDVARVSMQKHGAAAQDPSSPQVMKGAVAVMDQVARESAADRGAQLKHSLDAAVQYNEQVEKQRAEEEAAAAAAEAATQAQAAAEAAAAQANAAAGVGSTTITGGVALPASGAFTSGYGMRWGSFHSGVDIANSPGTPIYAAMAGTVIDSGPAQGYGQWIRIRHDDGSITVYGHMQTLGVSVGQRVAAGEYIAGMGSMGFSTGSHLHFEIWPDGANAVDPQAWLAGHGIYL